MDCPQHGRVTVTVKGDGNGKGKGKREGMRVRGMIMEACRLSLTLRSYDPTPNPNPNLSRVNKMSLRIIHECVSVFSFCVVFCIGGSRWIPCFGIDYRGQHFCGCTNGNREGVDRHRIVSAVVY